jgi:hypothetical protein
VPKGGEALKVRDGYPKIGGAKEGLLQGHGIHVLASQKVLEVHGLIIAVCG